jgi:hypothetical protein
MPNEVESGDLVLVAANGRVFYARVLGRERFGRFRLAPLDPSVRTLSAKLSDITDHWSHAGDPRPGRPGRSQASFDHLLDR